MFKKLSHTQPLLGLLFLHLHNPTKFCVSFVQGYNKYIVTSNKRWDNFSREYKIKLEFVDDTL
jgi:hypothetical protein